MGKDEFRIILISKYTTYEELIIYLYNSKSNIGNYYDVQLNVFFFFFLYIEILTDTLFITIVNKILSTM